MTTATLLAGLTKVSLGFAGPAALCCGAKLNRDTVLKVGSVFALSALTPKISKQLGLQGYAKWFSPKCAEALAYASVSYILTGSGWLTGLVINIQLLSSCIVEPTVTGQPGKSRTNREFLAQQAAGFLISWATLGVLIRMAGYGTRVALAATALFAAARGSVAICRFGIERRIHVRLEDKRETEGKRAETKPIDLSKAGLAIAATSAIYYGAGVVLRRYII